VKKMKIIILITIIFSILGLFFDWTRIEWKAANALQHETGILILLVEIVAIILLIKDKYTKILFILLPSVPILSLINFLYFSATLNISSKVDLKFSQHTVQVGFFITSIAAILALVLYGLYFIKGSNKQIK
jgi:Zn-finger domain-containing protein